MKNLLLSLCCLFLAISAGAQGMKDPSKWTVTAQPDKASSYNILFHVALEPGWHIWSLHPGGDGSLIAPSFKFNKGEYTPFGELGEQGMAIAANFEGIDGKVQYYMSEAQFNQIVRANHGDEITGEYTYQLCSETMCLPPKTVPFSIRIP